MSPLAEAMLLLSVASSATFGALAAEAADPAGSIAPYVGGGAGVIAVGALAEVTRRLLNGTLIPRVTKDYEDELGAGLRAAAEREADSMKDREESRKQTAAAIRAAEESTRAIDAMTREFNLLRRALEVGGDGRPAAS